VTGRDPQSLRLLCPAKINLFLEIIDRRPDGYHELDTVLLTVGLQDSLRIIVADEGVALEVAGADLPAGPENLVHRAATAFLSAFEVHRGVRILLTKRIPVEARLGGGSSDAAGTLRGLRDLFRPDLDPAALVPLAADLGMDVPFFLEGGAARGTGRGEVIEPLPAPQSFWLVLFFPEFGLSTPAVYARAEVPGPADRRSPDALLEALAGGDAKALAPHLHNRLAAAAARAEPALDELTARLGEALALEETVLLSGSGSALFTLAGTWDRAVSIGRAWNELPAGRALVVSTLRPGRG